MFVLSAAVGSYGEGEWDLYSGGMGKIEKLEEIYIKIESGESRCVPFD